MLLHLRCSSIQFSSSLSLSRPYLFPFSFFLAEIFRPRETLRGVIGHLQFDILFGFEIRCDVRSFFSLFLRPANLSLSRLSGLCSLILSSVISDTTSFSSSPSLSSHIPVWLDILSSFHFLASNNQSLLLFRMLFWIP